MLKGGEPEINDTETYDNGVKVVPSYLLEPVPVDGSNWQEVLVGSRLLHRRPASVRSRAAFRGGPLSTRRPSASGPARQGMSHERPSCRCAHHQDLPGVKALDNVNIDVDSGEIHAICGENGAGKSTLMKVLSGVYPHGSYEGEIIYDGEVRDFQSIRDSEAQGIIIIHQELALVPLLSIAENIFLGNERATDGVIDWPETFRQTEALLAKVGLNEAPGTSVGKLGVGKQQLVEIAKALSQERAPADPGRADRGPAGKRQPGAAGPAAGAEGAGRHQHHDQPQAERDAPRRRPHHRDPRRRHVSARWMRRKG